MTSALVNKTGIEANGKIVSTSESGQLLQAYLACDVASALLASFLVCPIITIIDRSIIQNASGAVRVRVFNINALKGKMPYILVLNPILIHCPCGLLHSDRNGDVFMHRCVILWLVALRNS